MTRLFVLLVILISSNGFAGQQIEGLTLKSATRVADQIAYQWLKNHDEAELELSGQIKKAQKAYLPGRTIKVNDLIAYRVCYRKLPSGFVEYCYEFNRTQQAKKRLH